MNLYVLLVRSGARYAPSSLSYPDRVSDETDSFLWRGSSFSLRGLAQRGFQVAQNVHSPVHALLTRTTGVDPTFLIVLPSGSESREFMSDSCPNLSFSNFLWKHLSQ